MVHIGRYLVTNQKNCVKSHPNPVLANLEIEYILQNRTVTILPFVCLIQAHQRCKP